MRQPSIERWRRLLPWAAVATTVGFVGNLISAAVGNESFSHVAWFAPAAIFTPWVYWQSKTTRTRISQAGRPTEMVLHWSYQASRDSARGGLKSLGAKEQSDPRYGSALVAKWSPGIGWDLYGCWLRCLYVQVEQQSVDFDFMRGLVDQLAHDAARMARRPFSRCLAVVVVVAEVVEDELRERFSSLQVQARSFASPVLVDIGRQRLVTVPICERGAGFAPYRHKMFSAIFGSEPVTA